MKSLNKKIILLLLLISLLTLTVTSAREVSLNSGNKVNIPDEYEIAEEINGTNPVVTIYAEPYGMFTLFDVDYVFSKTEQYSLSKEQSDILASRTVTIGSYEVNEYYHSIEGVDYFDYYLQNENTTINIMARPSQDSWNVEDPNNPVHRVIESI